MKKGDRVRYSARALRVLRRASADARGTVLSEAKKPPPECFAVKWDHLTARSCPMHISFLEEVKDVSK